MTHTQVPERGQLNIDHIAHFVAHIDAAAAALSRLGFTLTPFSAQSHRLTPDGPLVPAGSGNRCVMFERGYLEFLTPTHDTPVANQLRNAISRYVGVHLIAFGTAAPDADHARLAHAGFDPLPPVALQRQIGTEHGEATARFTVVRVPPSTMAEGRIQYCQQHTPELLWQSRWTAHGNGAVGLAAVLMCVDDPEAAANRYARFTGLAAQQLAHGWKLVTARGTLLFVHPEVLTQRLGVSAPTTPWIAGYALESRDLTATMHFLSNVGAALRAPDRNSVVFTLPTELGGIMVFGNVGANFTTLLL